VMYSPGITSPDESRSLLSLTDGNGDCLPRGLLATRPLGHNAPRAAEASDTLGVEIILTPLVGVESHAWPDWRESPLRYRGTPAGD
jgi:hypothetical protein